MTEQQIEELKGLWDGGVSFELAHQMADISPEHLEQAAEIWEELEELNCG